MISRTARFYLIAVGVCGFGASVWSAFLWNNSHLGQFAFLLVIAIATSRMKVRLPGVEGTVSVNFLFILLGAVELNAPQTVMIAAAATLSQCLWKPKHPVTSAQLIFNVSCSAYSGLACHLAFSSLAAHHVLALPHLPVLPVVGAVGSYFFLNTVSVSGIISLTEKKTLLETWHGSFLYTAPQYLIGALLVLVLDRLYSAFGWEILMLVMPVLFLIDYSYRLYLGQLEQEKKHVTEMSELQMRTIRGLALAIEAKDATTHYHVRRVRRFALMLAKQIPVSPMEQKALEAGALLHDIGKLAIPEHILSKPGKLTDEEFAKMKTHSLVGAEILESIGFPYPVVPIVRHHHEKWDGSGYPQGLSGEAIPIGARILSVVDCFDALTSDRQYRRAIGPSEALRFIRSEAGKSYDPRIVDLLEQHSGQFEVTDLEFACVDTPCGITRVEVDSSTGAAIDSGDPREASTSPRFMSTIAAAREEFQHLLDVTTELGNSLRIDEIFSLLSKRLKTMAPYDCMVIFLQRESLLVPLFSLGIDSELMSSQGIPLGEGLSGWVAKNRRPLTNGNPCLEPGYRAKSPSEQRLRSAISVPLESPSGVIGALTLYSMVPDFYTADHLRVLLSVSAKASLTIENALQFDEATKNATTDDLTGLPNARSLYMELERELSFCRRSGRMLSILVLDLNGFKQVNDRFGHLEGNRLLSRVAIGLTGCCREHDYCARVGGDEFVMMLRDAGPADLDRRLEQLCAAVVQAGFDLLGERVVSLSVGTAYYPADGEIAEALVAQADSRMYEMKRAGKLRRLVEVDPVAEAIEPADVSLTR